MDDGVGNNGGKEGLETTGDKEFGFDVVYRTVVTGTGVRGAFGLIPTLAEGYFLSNKRAKAVARSKEEGD